MAAYSVVGRSLYLTSLVAKRFISPNVADEIAVESRAVRGRKVGFLKNEVSGSPLPTWPCHARCTKVSPHAHSVEVAAKLSGSSLVFLYDSGPEARGHVLATHNVREFGRVAGLQIEDWAAIP